MISNGFTSPAKLMPTAGCAVTAKQEGYNCKTHNVNARRRNRNDH